jgi:hypothetical protein
MSTSSGRPWARTWPKTVLNAFTTCALAGAALAISCAPEVPSGVTSAVASALKVLEMWMTTVVWDELLVLERLDRLSAGWRQM